MDCVGDDAHIVPRICSGAVVLCIISRAVVSKPSGGIRSYLAVRLGLANAGG